MTNAPQEVLNSIAAHSVAARVQELVSQQKAGWVLDRNAFEKVYGLQVYTGGRTRTALVVYVDSMDFECDDDLHEILGL